MKKIIIVMIVLIVIIVCINNAREMLGSLIAIFVGIYDGILFPIRLSWSCITGILYTINEDIPEYNVFDINRIWIQDKEGVYWLGCFIPYMVGLIYFLVCLIKKQGDEEKS